MTLEPGSTAARQEDLLKKMRATRRVEWRQEITVRWLASALAWLGFGGRVALAALAALQVREVANGVSNFALAAAVAVLSVLNIALPKFVDDSKFRQRQAVHDRRARTLEALEVEMLAGSITLEEAAQRFADFLRSPPEAEVRRRR